MEVKKINEQLTVAGQVTPEQLQQAAAKGIQVCAKFAIA